MIRIESGIKNARNIKHIPAVNRATVVPLLVVASISRNLSIKESDATTEAMTPRSYPYKNEPKEANRATKN